MPINTLKPATAIHIYYGCNADRFACDEFNISPRHYLVILNGEIFWKVRT